MGGSYFSSEAADLEAGRIIRDGRVRLYLIPLLHRSLIHILGESNLDAFRCQFGTLLETIPHRVRG